MSVASAVRRLVFGSAEKRRANWAVFLGGYGLCVGVALAAFARLGIGGVELLVFTLFFSPFVVSTVSAARGGGLALSLCIGLVPGLVWIGLALGGVVGSGGPVPSLPEAVGSVIAYLWLPGALVATGGFVIGAGVSWVFDRLEQHLHGPSGEETRVRQ